MIVHAILRIAIIRAFNESAGLLYQIRRKSPKVKVKGIRSVEIYSASMKSYQYQNNDISENIYYSSLDTVTFMFLGNGMIVWRGKTVTRALELWCL